MTGLTEADLLRALAAADLVAPVRYDDVTASTNATAIELATDGAPEWTLVAAGHQTAGRGRLGRTWTDRPGEALMFSIVLRPSIEPRRAGLLPLLAGAAAAVAAREVGGPAVTCKWPNDLVLEDRKVGGVLAESALDGDRLRFVVVGVGVNLGTHPVDVAGAGSLAGIDPAKLLAAFLGSFRAAYAPGDAYFAASVRDMWRTVSATIGRNVEAMRAGASPIRGRAVDLDDRGALVIETEDGRVAVASGEVQHLR